MGKFLYIKINKEYSKTAIKEKFYPNAIIKKPPKGG
jgi:hypothetical protein